MGSLSQTTTYESPAHSSTGTLLKISPLAAWELTISCSISLPGGGSFAIFGGHGFRKPGSRKEALVGLGRLVVTQGSAMRCNEKAQNEGPYV